MLIEALEDGSIPVAGHICVADHICAKELLIARYVVWHRLVHLEIAPGIGLERGRIVGMPCIPAYFPGRSGADDLIIGEHSCTAEDAREHLRYLLLRHILSVVVCPTPLGCVLIVILFLLGGEELLPECIPHLNSINVRLDPTLFDLLGIRADIFEGHVPFTLCARRVHRLRRLVVHVFVSQKGGFVGELRILIQIIQVPGYKRPLPVLGFGELELPWPAESFRSLRVGVADLTNHLSNVQCATRVRAQVGRFARREAILRWVHILLRRVCVVLNIDFEPFVIPLFDLENGFELYDLGLIPHIHQLLDHIPLLIINLNDLFLLLR